jgi:hypothetical protein
MIYICSCKLPSSDVPQKYLEKTRIADHEVQNIFPQTLFEMWTHITLFSMSIHLLPKN